jgi:thymidylate synthase (FAD)
MDFVNRSEQFKINVSVYAENMSIVQAFFDKLSHKDISEEKTEGIIVLQDVVRNIQYIFNGKQTYPFNNSAIVENPDTNYALVLSCDTDDDTTFRNLMIDIMLKYKCIFAFMAWNYIQSSRQSEQIESDTQFYDGLYDSFKFISEDYALKFFNKRSVSNIAVVGNANVGKSTFVNYLACDDKYTILKTKEGIYVVFEDRESVLYIFEYKETTEYVVLLDGMIIMSDPDVFSPTYYQEWKNQRPQLKTFTIHNKADTEEKLMIEEMNSAMPNKIISHKYTFDKSAMLDEIYQIMGIPFISPVKLITYSKNAENPDMSIMDSLVYCARVSNPVTQEKGKGNVSLIRYLMKHKHWSPFEMANICLEIKTTRDIGRQIIRHRTFSFQEFSQRYAEVPELICDREARLQDTKNRQNSIVSEDTMINVTWSEQQQLVKKLALQTYKAAIDMGIAKEQARALLPEGLAPTVMYMNGNIRSWIHYIEVRTGPETQKEHRIIAKQCAKAISKVFPEIMSFVQET